MLFTEWHELSLCNSGLFASSEGIYLACVLYDARRNTPRNACIGDEQNNGNTRHYRNQAVLAALKEN